MISKKTMNLHSWLYRVNKLECFLTPSRIKWYSRSILFTLGVSFLIAVFGGKDVSTLSGRLGGDYPAFYGAGRIIAEGDWKNLYSVPQQIEVQKALFVNGDTGLLPFSYPPFVALAYYPLSLVSYRISFLIHTLLMVGALILTIQLIRPFNAAIDRYHLSALVLALSFYPLFRAVFGGQNTAFLLLLTVGSWRAVSARREWCGGLVLGLLLFKPQFGIPLIGLYVLSGRWRVGLASVLTAVILYTLSSWVSGPLWVVPWAKFTWWFSQVDAGVNSTNSISWLGFLEAIWGTNSQAALILGWGMILLTALGLALLWIIRGRRANLTALLSITMPALVLLPPHVMYYDMSLVLFSYAAIVTMDSEKLLPIIGGIWLLSFSQILAKIIGFSKNSFATAGNVENVNVAVGDQAYQEPGSSLLVRRN